jgi:hypothetical protein
MFSLYYVVFCRVHACYIFIDSIVLSVVALHSFLQEVVLTLSLAPSRTNSQPRQDLRDVGYYRAQSGGVYDHVCPTPSDFWDRHLRRDAPHPMTL